jgi:hypothetical protein
MQKDAYELSLSTSSAAAAALYREGVALMLSLWPGAAEKLDAAIAEDPQFALAHAARARLHAMSAQPGEARERIAVAGGLVAGATPRERSHVAGLARAIGGPPSEALKAALAHADEWPRDVLILSLPLGAFGLFAFSGMADHDQARVDLCARHARHFAQDDWWFLNTHGWALAENGEVARGRAMIEASFALRRENANTVHALAHAMFEAGSNGEAETLIADWLPTYDRSGMLYGHVAWHAALAALERDDLPTAMQIYAEHVQPRSSLGLPINIVSDAASFFWRLDAYGYKTPAGGWAELADYARRAFPRPGHAFIDAHMALIEAANGERDALLSRVAALEDLVAEGALGAGAVVPAIGRGALAFAEGDYAGCARILEPVASEVVRIGGSGAQRQIVEDTLVVALMRAGETDKARALLRKRLDRRPSPRDARWQAQLSA